MNLNDYAIQFSFALVEMVLELDGEREGRARNYSLHIITKYYPVKHSSQPGLISNLFFPRRGRKEAHRGRNEGKEIHQAR